MVTRAEQHANYQTFINKFTPKLTTDDCMTPPRIYDTVKDWAVEHYHIHDRPIVRPFYPGGDYEHYTYPANCVVLDNPPFSILSKITDFYLARGIDFFLFAPGLVSLNYCANRTRVNIVACRARIVYENGAKVATSFITTLGDTFIINAPDLVQRVAETIETMSGKQKKSLLRYEYPDNVITSSRLGELSEHGVSITIQRDEARFIRELDAQRPYKKGIYGSGLLVSDTVARKYHQAAQTIHAADHVWQLSQREQRIIQQLNQQSQENNHHA